MVDSKMTVSNGGSLLASRDIAEHEVAHGVVEESGKSVPQKFKSHTIEEGENLHTILKNAYEQQYLSADVLKQHPQLASTRKFPEKLSTDQARWLIGLTLRDNPTLAKNPHLLQPGKTINVPFLGDVARALVAGAPSNAAEKAIIAQATGDVVAALSILPFGRIVAEAMTSRLQEPPSDFEKFKGAVHVPTTSALKKP